MQLTLVYDDRKKPGSTLIADHGFSCYIETDEEVILFDTGTDGRTLLHNLSTVKKDPRKISKIVISHEHYDHNGGLPLLHSYIDSAIIYRIQSGFSNDSFTTQCISNPLKIADSVYSTGRLPGNPIDEQSLVLIGSKGNVILTGCSHSGVDAIIHAAQTYGKITGIIGGLHGFKDFSVLDQLNAIYPCHCTKYKQQIKTLFPHSYHDCYVGLTITI